jgi:hypothetical protein
MSMPPSDGGADAGGSLGGAAPQQPPATPEPVFHTPLPAGATPAAFGTPLATLRGAATPLTGTQCLALHAARGLARQGSCAPGLSVRSKRSVSASQMAGPARPL